MITDERLKQLMKDLGRPNSRSLLLALRQVDMETELRSLAEIERLRAALTISRGQWIHSVNAAQCLAALEMSDCAHSYYQSQKHNGKWLCQHCGELIETWQRLNLALSEVDELRDRLAVYEKPVRDPYGNVLNKLDPPINPPLEKE
jgi:hypothetical protein